MAKLTKFDYAAFKKSIPKGVHVPATLDDYFGKVELMRKSYQRYNVNEQNEAVVDARITYLQQYSLAIKQLAADLRKTIKDAADPKYKSFRGVVDAHVELLRKYETERQNAIKIENGLGHKDKVTSYLKQFQVDKPLVF